MKKIPIFIINLKNSTDRRHYLENIFNNSQYEVSFFDAVNGKEISDEEISSKINMKKFFYNHKRNLTKGEMGCALSHRAVYQKMVDEKISKAIILEDDVKPNTNFSYIYNFLCNLEKKNYIIKLDLSVKENLPYSIFGKFGKMKYNSCVCKKPVYSVWDARAYYIDIVAANNILKHFPKIVTFADNWDLLAKKSKLRLCYPQSFDDIDILPSTLAKDRLLYSNELEKEPRKKNICIRCIEHFFYIIKKIYKTVSPFN